MFWPEYLRLNLRDRILLSQLDQDSDACHLLRDGICIKRDFVTPDVADRMLQKIPRVEEMRESPEGTRTRFCTEANTIRGLEVFFESEQIKQTMHTLIGTEARMFRSVAQRRTFYGWTGSFEQFFHADSWRYRYKAFLYLTDVGPKNAPLVYAPKTSRGLWRVLRDEEINRIYTTGEDSFLYDENSLFVGSLLPHQANMIFRKKGITPISVTAPKGTLIMFDARGLHKVAPLESDTRAILSSYWVEGSKHA